MPPEETPFDAQTEAERRKPDRSAARLLGDLAAETGLLIRQEAALFKAELRENLGRAGRGGLALALGAAIVFSGWLALLATAALALAIVLPAWLAALVVAVATLALGGVLILFGARRIGAAALVPRRSLNSLRDDEAWIKEQIR